MCDVEAEELELRIEDLESFAEPARPGRIDDGPTAVGGRHRDGAAVERSALVPILIREVESRRIADVENAGQGHDIPLDLREIPERFRVVHRGVDPEGESLSDRLGYVQKGEIIVEASPAQ